METTTNSPILAMEVGTYVRSATIGTEAYSNKIGQIADALPNRNGQVWVKFLNQEYDSGMREFLILPSQLYVLPDQENAPRIQILEAWESRYHNQRSLIQRYETNHDALCDTVIEVMDELGYCDEGDRAIEKINESLGKQGRSIRLRMRQRRFEVEVNIQTTVWASNRVTVMATSADEALETVQEDPDSYVDAADLVCDEVISGSCDFEYECELY